MRIAKVLLDYGAESDAKNKYGDDCLHYAKRNKSKGFEKLILSKLAKR